MRLRPRPILVAALLSIVPLWPCLGQTTSVSGTIVDANSQAWFSGSVQFTFRPADSNPTAQYFLNGVPFDKNTTLPTSPLALDGAGSFSGLAVPSNTSISPGGSTWTVKVCPASTTSCASANLTITGATQNISGQIIPPPVHLDLSVPLLGARAYTDSEVFGANAGSMYFNNTDNRMHVCLLTGFPPCTWFVLNGGGGTVTSFSAGNLSPLFTTSVATATTTPALSFALSNAGPGTILGNPTGAPGPPSYNAPSSFSGIGTVTNVATSSPISGGPITTTGTISCPTCVVSVSGTANQITSSGGTTPTLSVPATFIAPGSIQATTSLTGTSVTDSGLTNGNCVQASTGGLLSTIASPCGTVSGVTVIRTATAAGCTTAGGNSFQTCDNTLTWIGGGFADTSYIPTCSGVDPRMQASGGDGSSGEILDLNIRSFSTTTIIVTTTQLAARASKYDTVYCIGVHP